jgi:hypothetical protein
MLVRRWEAHDGACEDCQALHGLEVEDGGEFTAPDGWKGLPPRHPNCKCWYRTVRLGFKERLDRAARRAWGCFARYEQHTIARTSLEYAPRLKGGSLAYYYPAQNQVMVSQGRAAALTLEELTAVVLHEFAHAVRPDWGEDAVDDFVRGRGLPGREAVNRSLGYAEAWREDLLCKAAWDERLHPRDEAGRWSESPGGHGTDSHGRLRPALARHHARIEHIWAEGDVADEINRMGGTAGALHQTMRDLHDATAGDLDVTPRQHALLYQDVQNQSLRLAADLSERGGERNDALALALRNMAEEAFRAISRLSAAGVEPVTCHEDVRPTKVWLAWGANLPGGEDLAGRGRSDGAPRHR